MPLIIPQKLSASTMLQRENVFVMHDAQAVSQDIRPLRILVANLSEDKTTTEIQFARVLANSPLQVELDLVSLKPTDFLMEEEYFSEFYKKLEDIKKEKYDGMIIVGSGDEYREFEKCENWNYVVELFEYSKTNVYSVIYVGWMAQAALYYFFNIPKEELDEQAFGVYAHQITRPQNPLVRGFDDNVYFPHNRIVGAGRQQINKEEELRILVDSDEVGPSVISTENGRQIFVMGHGEYDKEVLGLQYYRLVQQKKNPKVPVGYFKDDKPGKDVIVNWRSHCNLLYSNWLNYYVYQGTPFNLDDI